MSPETVTESKNGIAGEAPKKRGRPKKVAAETSTATTAPEAAPKKRGRPKGGAKAGRKPAAAQANGLPDPSTLPLDYLIRCAEYLDAVKDKLNKLGK